MLTVRLSSIFVLLTFLFFLSLLLRLHFRTISLQQNNEASLKQLTSIHCPNSQSGKCLEIKTSESEDEEVWENLPFLLSHHPEVDLMKRAMKRLRGNKSGRRGGGIKVFQPNQTQTQTHDERRREIVERQWNDKKQKETKPKASVPHVDVVFMIVSKPSNFDIRQVGRTTWRMEKLDPYPSMAFYYLVGKPDNELLSQKIEAEQQTHGDIVMLSEVKDSYNNLTLKTFEGLKYFNKHFNFTFLFKTDDDCFFRLYVFQQRLKKITKDLGTRGIYIGRLYRRGRVYKNQGFKNSDFSYSDTQEYFPYMHGSGYILSTDLVQMIAEPKFPLRILFNEDTTIGFWVAPYKITKLDEYDRMSTNRHEEMCDETKRQNHWYLMHYVHKELFNKCYKTFIASSYDRNQTNLGH